VQDFSTNFGQTFEDQYFDVWETMGTYGPIFSNNSIKINLYKTSAPFDAIASAEGLMNVNILNPNFPTTACPINGTCEP